MHKLLQTALMSVACAILLAAAWLPATAQPALVPVDHYPPWKFTENQSTPTGIDITITNLLAKRVGLEVTYVAYPWGRCLHALKDGSADLVSGILRREDREEYLHFIEPPYKIRSTKAFYVRTGEAHTVQSYVDLYGKVVGVKAKAKLFPRFDADDDIIKDVVNSDLLNLAKLTAGRIDTFIATELTADYLIAVNGYADAVEKAPLKFDEPVQVYFAIAKKSPLMEKADQLSEEIAKMRDSGEIDAIISNFSEYF